MLQNKSAHLPAIPRDTCGKKLAAGAFDKLRLTELCVVSRSETQSV
jgi:hypothetical protein